MSAEEETNPWDDEAPGPEDAAVDAAWELLDAGDAEGALEALADVDDDWPDRWIPEALARIELGELPRARTLIARVREILDDSEEHPDLLWAQGNLALREWRIADAKEALLRFERIEPGAGVYDRLSLVSDLEGDFERADLLIERANDFLGDDAAPVPRLSHEEFDAVVEAALEELPREFKTPLETTEIVVEPMPAEWMIDRSAPEETPPDLLGLFVGTSDLDGPPGAGVALPRRIYLFQRNLERMARTRDELIEEARKTLFHEIGHMLGFDEEGVAAMGLE